jgi:hypothetical protein
VIETLALIATLPLSVTGLFWSISVRRYRVLQRLWRDTARRAGLKNLRTGSAVWSGGVTADAEGLTVRFGAYQRGRDEYYHAGTVIAVAIDSGVTLRPERESDLESIFGPREIEIGDPAFDDAVWVLGAPDVVRALLDAETRAELRTLIAGVIGVAGHARLTCQGSFAVENGVLKAEVRGDRDGGSQPETLAGVVKTLLAMARKLQRPVEVVRRIAENTLREPLSEVRVANLRLLAESHPRHPRTREALQRGLEDENEEVQLVASLALGGDEGRRTLTEIAAREWSSDYCAAQAVSSLGGALPKERLHSILTHALRTRRVRTAEACLEALGSVGGEEMVEPLAKVLALEAGELGVAAARALGASQAEGAEAPLLRALERAPLGVREAAAEALGRAGTARAVLALKEVAASSGATAALRRAARQAVGAIQARLQGVASPGQLSLAGGESGQLSVAEAETGQLSLAEGDRRGQVSIARKPR